MENGTGKYFFYTSLNKVNLELEECFLRKIFYITTSINEFVETKLKKLIVRFFCIKDDLVATKNEDDKLGKISQKFHPPEVFLLDLNIDIKTKNCSLGLHSKKISFLFS